MSRSYFLNTFSRAARNVFSFGNKATLYTSSACNTIHARWVAATKAELLKRVNSLKEEGKYPTVIKRSEFLDWNYDAEIYAFGRRLNEEFDDSLLREALRDHYYIFQKEKTAPHSDEASVLKSNKELAVTGEALIENFSKNYLRTIWPLLPEEGIEEIAVFLCSSDVLAKVGFGIGLKDLILCEEYPPNEETCATCMSAIVGTLNVSSGQERCNLFIRDFIVTQIIGKDLWDIWKIEDPFSLVKELFAQNDMAPPEPRIIGELGKNTLEAVYNIGIYSNKEFIGSGYGESPQIGLTVALLDTLGRFFGNTLSSNPFPFNEDLQNTHLKITPNPSLKEWRLTSAVMLASIS